MLNQNTFPNISAIAKAEKVDRSYISRMVNLTTLAPEIQAAIPDENLPDTVSLFNLASDTPLSWEEQRARVRKFINVQSHPGSRREVLALDAPSH